MKVLFALNQNKQTDVENKLLTQFTSYTEKTFEIVKEYDLSGIVQRFKLEQFDVLVLNEELERNNPVTTTFIDDLTDKFSKTRIVLIVQSDHEKDAYIKKLFNIGIYDLLYSHDITIENIVSLIIKPRNKAEAKIYLDLHDIDDVEVENEKKYIPEDELFNILNYFANIDEEDYVQAFEHIVSQYNDDQIIYLIKKLPEGVKVYLEQVKNMTYMEYRNRQFNVPTIEEIPEEDIEESLPKNETKAKAKVEKAEKEDKVDKGFKLPNFPSMPSIQKAPTTEKIITKVETVNVFPSDYKKIILLISPESTGKTEIATNLAVAISKNTKKTVSLIDLDLEKCGVLYNFKVDGGEKGENYFKFKALYNKLDEALEGNGIELSEELIRNYAIYQHKDLFVYTGSQEASVNNNISNIGNRPMNEVLFNLIKEIKDISDVVIIDVGTSVNTPLLLELMDLGNVDKLLVTTQNIETLNTIGYKLRFNHSRYYNNWGLIVNKFDKRIPVKESEIISFFNDSDIGYLKYDIKDVHYIPYSDELIISKSKREVAYTKDKEFANGIDDLISKIYPVDVKKKRKLFGML